MESWFNQLRLDYWYKMVILAALFIFALALTVPMQVSNAAVALISLGVFWLAIGEWINHPLQTRIYHGFTSRSFPRHNSPLGLCFVAIGLALVLRGAWLV